MTTLSGRVALVTGGGRDVGANICLTLAEAGATIAITYNSSKAEAEAVAAGIVKAGGCATAYQADVSNLAQVTSMVPRPSGPIRARATSSERSVRVVAQRGFELFERSRN